MVTTQAPARSEVFARSSPRFALFQSKLRPPQGRGDGVPRADLIDRIDDDFAVVRYPAR